MIDASESKLKIEIVRTKAGVWTLRVNGDLELLYDESRSISLGEVGVALMAGVSRATARFLEYVIPRVEKKK